MNRRSAIKAMVTVPAAMALPGNLGDSDPKPIMWDGKPYMALKRTIIIERSDYDPNATFAWMYIRPRDILGHSRQEVEARLDCELHGLREDILEVFEREYGLGKEST